MLWKSVHTCLRNELPQVSESVFFVEFEWKHHNFLNIITKEWDLKILLFNYWNDLVLGSVETYFLEVDEYLSLKWAATGLWEGPITEFEWKYHIFLNTKTEE